MNSERPFVIRTKLFPSRLGHRILKRDRLLDHLASITDYRLTLIQAGAGYGKTTMLASLVDLPVGLAWYHIEIQDSDLQVFLLYLLRAFQLGLDIPLSEPAILLETWEGPANMGLANAFIDSLVSDLAQVAEQPIVFVLDDAHLIKYIPDASQTLTRLLHYAPDNLHIVLSTRYQLLTEMVSDLRLRGEVLELYETDLAFQLDEVQLLFNQQFGVTLNENEAQALTQETEGWAIALQLIYQGRFRQRERGTAASPRSRISMKDDLFRYLAKEVLEQQDDAVQQFMRKTAVLRVLSPAVCDAVAEIENSADILTYLDENGLFVIHAHGDVTRYHHLFHEFLYELLPEADRITYHRRAAAYFEREEDWEEAIHHHLQADQHHQAAGLIGESGKDMVYAGRLELLSNWVLILPPDVIEQNPELLNYLGDIARLQSRFTDALTWYQQAEERCRAQNNTYSLSRALRGQARVYLDTVNPKAAEEHLREALRITDGQNDREARATLLELLAENQINRGRSDEAQRFQAEAKALREEGPGEAELDVRVLLRTGQLDEALQALQERADQEREQPVLRPRAHRETLLLLSLIETMQGQAKPALENAIEGTKRGELLNSPFVTAVGLMRQGHALLIGESPTRFEDAESSFQRALEVSEPLSIDRLKIEANWGLCRLYGYQGDLVRALDVAEQSIAIASRLGDDWIIAHLRVSLGSSYVLAKRYDEALVWLEDAMRGFYECGDPFGETLARLWQCLIWQKTGEDTRLKHGLEELLPMLDEHNYGYLFSARTLAGPPDYRILIPLLIFARDEDVHRDISVRLLDGLGFERLESHAGYQLRVEVLGGFRAWRGEQVIESGDWQREKARQLFLLFISSRETMLDREVIWGMLWPEADEDTANRNFRVTLNAVYNAIEPERGRGEPSAFIMRDGSLYGLRSDADIALDVDALETRLAELEALTEDDIEQALDTAQEAIALYPGDYLAEYPYDDWHQNERVRLKSLFMSRIEQFMARLVKAERWNDLLTFGNAIIHYDDCWEKAHFYLMNALYQRDDHAQAVRTYQRLSECLQKELGVDPSQETTRLFQTITESTTS